MALPLIAAALVSAAAPAVIGAFTKSAKADEGEKPKGEANAAPAASETGGLSLGGIIESVKSIFGKKGGSPKADATKGAEEVANKPTPSAKEIAEKILDMLDMTPEKK